MGLVAVALMSCVSATAFELTEQICSNQTLATGTEQKTIGAGATLADKLGESPENLLQITVLRYVPWKDMSVEPEPRLHGCFRNWATRFYVRYLTTRVDSEQNLHTCEVTLAGQKYDDVMGSAGGNTAEVRVVSEICTLASERLVERIASCTAKIEAEGPCESSSGPQAYPDVFDNCTCKTTDDLVNMDNLQNRYGGFFVPGRFEGRPNHVVPFDGLESTTYNSLKDLRVATGQQLFQ